MIMEIMKIIEVIKTIFLVVGITCTILGLCAYRYVKTRTSLVRKREQPAKQSADKELVIEDSYLEVHTETLIDL